MGFETTDALVVIDAQNDFCPGGALPVPGGDEIVAPVNRLLPHAPLAVCTQDWHPPGHSSFASSHPGLAPHDTVTMRYGEQVLWPDHCVQGTRGAELVDGLAGERVALLLRKGMNPEIDSYSAFFENDRRTATGLAACLQERGVTRLVLVGLAFDYCVKWSALDARAGGFDVVVIEDACRAIDLDGSAATAREELDAAGVKRTTVDAFLG